MKALLEDETLIKGESFVAPDIIIYEVANAIRKHECLIKQVENGNRYVAILYDLIESGKLSAITPNETLVQKSYLIARQHSTTIYDAVFVALALQLGVSLKTLDKAQFRVLKSERVKKNT